jgi:flagellar biosynthesis chaperone FliJ
MKPLKTLVRLNKDKLDKILAEINKLEELKAKLKIKKEDLIAEAKAETDKYAGTEFAYMLDKYLADCRDKQQKITSQIQNLELQIIRLRNDLSIQFTELKKYEIALEKRQQALVEKQKKAETKQLDEFNTSKFVFDKKD